MRNASTNSLAVNVEFRMVYLNGVFYGAVLFFGRFMGLGWNGFQLKGCLLAMLVAVCGFIAIRY